MLKLDNVRDHRAGTIDHPFQNTRKSGFACITLLSTVGFMQLDVGDNVSNCYTVDLKQACDIGVESLLDVHSYKNRVHRIDCPKAKVHKQSVRWVNSRNIHDQFVRQYAQQSGRDLLGGWEVLFGKLCCRK